MLCLLRQNPKRILDGKRHCIFFLIANLNHWVAHNVFINVIVERSFNIHKESVMVQRIFLAGFVLVFAFSFVTLAIAQDTMRRDTTGHNYMKQDTADAP